jgi:3-oxoacyl-[acyl-carrier protein] reductase
VVITGGGQGIGRELSRQFAAAGATVVVADLNPGKAEGVCHEIEAARGKSLALQVDVADKASVDAMAAAVLETYGRVDVLVNNAGIFANLGRVPFDEIDLNEWDQVLRVNVTGTYLCVRACAAAMRKAQWGRVINMSSDSVPRGVANYLHYVTSKAAVIGMTNAMARELGPFGITVNAIRPGSVATEVDRVHPPTAEFRHKVMNEQCLRRVQLPEDVVGLVLFLATPAAGFITGQTIAADGGLTHSS